MGKLRERMQEEMVLRGMSVRTQESYLAAVVALTKHYGCAPDTIDDEQVRSYMLYLLVERKLSASSVNVAVSAIRFFFHTTSKRKDLHLRPAAAQAPVETALRTRARVDRRPDRGSR